MQMNENNNTHTHTYVHAMLHSNHSSLHLLTLDVYTLHCTIVQDYSGRHTHMHNCIPTYPIRPHLRIFDLQVKRTSEYNDAGIMMQGKHTYNLQVERTFE